MLAVVAALLAGCAPTPADPLAPNGTAPLAPNGIASKGSDHPGPAERYRLPQNWADLTVTTVDEGSIVTMAMSQHGWRSYLADGADFQRAAWRAVKRAAPEMARVVGVRQQFQCHAAGAWLAGERDWDLESWRSENPNWAARILSAGSLESVCNW